MATPVYAEADQVLSKAQRNVARQIYRAHMLANVLEVLNKVEASLGPMDPYRMTTVPKQDEEHQYDHGAKMQELKEYFRAEVRLALRNTQVPNRAAQPKTEISEC